VGTPGLGQVRPGINVSDQVEGWQRNFRVPDVAVRLNDGRAQICPTHWVGGPDLVVEVASRGDRTRQKLAFYGSIGTRELLRIVRRPWAVELYRLEGGLLRPAGVSRPETSDELASQVVPLAFRLTPGSHRPTLHVRQVPAGPSWAL
jgi:Uma2 family endonuclease